MDVSRLQIEYALKQRLCWNDDESGTCYLAEQTSTEASPYWDKCSPQMRCTLTDPCFNYVDGLFTTRRCSFGKLSSDSNSLQSGLCSKLHPDYGIALSLSNATQQTLLFHIGIQMCMEGRTQKRKEKRAVISWEPHDLGQSFANQALRELALPEVLWRQQLLSIREQVQFEDICGFRTRGFLDASTSWTRQRSANMSAHQHRNVVGLSLSL